MNVSFLSVELIVTLFVRLSALKVFFLMVILLTVSLMQAAQGLTHFLPKVPLLTCPKLTFAFFTIYFYSCHSHSVTRRFMGFFPFHYFFQLISSRFWFVIVSLPQPRCPILTLLTMHFFVCDSLDSVYFQQLHDRLATEF